MTTGSSKNLQALNDSNGWETSSSRAYFNVLDSLRGLAAICIALFHFYGQWAGYLAVEFFFVLSGFVLAHGVSARRHPLSLTLYAGRRLVRLYPMHLYGLVAFAVVLYAFEAQLPTYPDGTIFTLLQHLTLTQGVGLNPHGLTWNYPSWAISVEFWAGIFAVLLLWGRVHGLWFSTLSSVCLLIIYLNTGYLGVTYQNYYGFVNSGLLRGLASLLLGVLSYRIYSRYSHNGWSRVRGTLMESGCVFAVLLILFGRSGIVSSLDFYAPLVFMLSVPIFAFESGHISEWLHPLSGLGTLSYSIYLNQATILLAIGPLADGFHMPVAIEVFVYLILLVAYSKLTYSFIERPAREKGLAFLTNARSAGRTPVGK